LQTTQTEPRIFDTHVHFPRNWEDPGADPQPIVEHLMERLRESGIVKAALLSGGRWGLDHRRCIELLRPFEDLAIPVAMVDPDETDRMRVWQLYEMGYRGLKLIGVSRDYDTRDYFPMYAAAEALEMPIVLHLGVIGGGIDYSRTHPRRDPEAVRRLEFMRGRAFGMRDVSATRMHPFHLDTIANNFPALKLIGAHLGGTGNYDAAASVARWRHNVFFDLSGGETIERHAVEGGYIGKEIGIEKLTFGSDCPADEVHEHVARFVRIFDDLGLSDDEKERLWFRNAAEIFGLEPPALAAE
jgi:predicted TIM-barrel fold metal-dependent hydrolase